MHKHILLLSRLCFTVSLISVSYLALMPLSELPDIQLWDKANHFIAFFVLSFLLYFSFVEIGFCKVVMVLLSYGLLLEVLQRLTSFRTFSWFDLFADFIGIVVGFGFAYLLKPYLNNNYKNML